jgi:TolB-like protein/DNA-binding winged helix-turn-helix (wHTH) protein
LQFRFADHSLDTERRELRRGDALVALEPQVFDLLVYLVQNHDRVVSKDDLLEAVWDGRIVSDSALTSRITAVRKAIGDSGEAQRLIRTVPRKGIRFIGDVWEVQKPAPSLHALSAAATDEPMLPSLPLGNGSDELLVKIEAPRNPDVHAATEARHRQRSWRAILASVIAALGLLASVVAIWHPRWLWFGEPHQAPRLSIVVLPFSNLSNDPDQQYFADGISEDLTTNLSRIPHSFVISRNTAFTYRNKPVDTKQIGRELGVRYVLAGSVQRSGDHARVTAQLIDAETDAHLWAEQFDRDLGDLFALQNEITRLIASTLKLELIRAEEIRRTEHPDALDYILRGRAVFLNPPTRDSFTKAISLFEHALALDPKFAEAQTNLAGALVRRVLTGLSASAAPDLARADGLLDQALPASPRSEYAHFVKGELLRALNRSEEAIPEYEIALAINRNFPPALHGLALVKLDAGSLDAVIPLEEQAIRLSPRDPVIGYRYGVIGTVHLLQSRTDEAIVWLEKARSTMPSVPFNHIRLASAYALRGEPERAAAELAEARRLSGDNRYSSIARLKAGGLWGSLSPKTRAMFEATYFGGLRRAGMPEE